MNTADFAREIEKANRRMVELRRAARADGPTPWSESALAELSSALEELRVAEEELLSRNAELADANAESEFERHRYRELFMSTPFGQLLTDLGGTILTANRAAGELFSVPSASLTGRGLAAAIDSGDRDRFTRWLQVLADAAHDASVCSDCGGTAEFQMQPTGGPPALSVEITAAPLVDRSGRIDSIRWCVRDVSERDKARDAERLASEARRKDEFLAVLAHELRNPLAAITLASDILTASSGDPARKRWAAEVVQRHADQLRHLVDDLLDVSRVSQGKISLRLESIDLRDPVRSALESCQPILQGKQHAVSVALPESRVTVRGDGARLRQVIANLIDNAGKYTPPGGRIDIDLRVVDRHAVLEVRDTGIGIPAPMLERIFGQYEQVAGGAALRERGLGLGLALVRQLVGLHGGTVHATSRGEGQGSRFLVQLPASLDEPIASADAVDGPTEREMADGTRILIVDDNADAAALLAEKLRGVGWTVDLAHAGEGGLAAARSSRCQVALIDLGLPDVDGFAVCRALKSEQPELRVVALTGYGDAHARDRAREAGFDHFLVKPLSPRDVLAALEELVGSRE